MAVDTPGNFRKTLFCRKVVVHLYDLIPTLPELGRGLPFVKDVQVVEHKLIVTLDNPEEQNPILISRLVQAGAQIQFVGELRHSLEDIYLQMIRKG